MSTPVFDLSPESFGLPDEETMSCEDGLVENHYYRDLRWMDWSDYQDICDYEQELLDYRDEGGDLQSDDALEQFEDNLCFTLDLDPGIASTVAALAAAGAVPVTSCSGDEGHYETHPLVVFWATEDLKDVLIECAAAAGVKLESVGSQLMVYHESGVSPLMSFAENLFDQCCD